MRERDYDKLCDENGHYFQGGLPNLGKAMPKGGYRWCVGFVQTASGKPQPWREYLGHDLLLAQYRAREMNDVWASHVQNTVNVAMVL